MTKEELKNLPFDEVNNVVNLNAIEIGKKIGKKVHPLIFNTDKTGANKGDYIIGYFRAPSLYEKMSLVDSYSNEKGRTFQGFMMLETLLLKDYSDKIFFNKENSEFHDILIGASLNVYGTIEINSNLSIDLKKNGE